jgi:hypothetical protein
MALLEPWWYVSRSVPILTEQSQPVVVPNEEWRASTNDKSSGVRCGGSLLLKRLMLMCFRACAGNPAIWGDITESFVNIARPFDNILQLYYKPGAKPRSANGKSQNVGTAKNSLGRRWPLSRRANCWSGAFSPGRLRFTKAGCFARRRLHETTAAERFSRMRNGPSRRERKSATFSPACMCAGSGSRSSPILHESSIFRLRPRLSKSCPTACGLQSPDLRPHFWHESHSGTEAAWRRGPSRIQSAGATVGTRSGLCGLRCLRASGKRPTAPVPRGSSPCGGRLEILGPPPMRFSQTA